MFRGCERDLAAGRGDAADGRHGAVLRSRVVLRQPPHTDNFITVDSTGGANPCIINLPLADTRTFPLGIKNLGTIALAVTPNGSDTIDGVAAAYSVPVAATPEFPCIWLLPDPDGSGWWILASHGV